MATICFTCNDPIVNNEFIECNGSCGNFFHSKCASINKATLNMITRNANVHWFCHQCNNSKKNIAESIIQLKESMDQMSGTLANNLTKFTDGFRSLSESLIGNISNLGRPNVHLVGNVTSKSTNKRPRDESDQPPHRTQKRLILGSNETNMSIAAVNTLDAKSTASVRRKSVVVSNINNAITAEYLEKYVSEQLKIEREFIRVTSLFSNRATYTSLQYRISTPESHYESLMKPESWSKNVKIRDYVYKGRENEV